MRSFAGELGAALIPVLKAAAGWAQLLPGGTISFVMSVMATKGVRPGRRCGGRAGGSIVGHGGVTFVDACPPLRYNGYANHHVLGRQRPLPLAAEQGRARRVHNRARWVHAGGIILWLSDLPCPVGLLHWRQVGPPSNWPTIEVSDP